MAFSGNHPILGLSDGTIELCKINYKNVFLAPFVIEESIVCKMSKLGYVRVSTTEHNIARQVEQLNHCEKVFVDKMSGSAIERSDLEEMMAYI